jgi:hypothetical protein
MVGQESMQYHDEQDKTMQITVSMNNQGYVWASTCQGQRLAECFFKAADETVADLEHMGYQSLADHYPTASIAVGIGIEAEDLDDLFVEA